MLLLSGLVLGGATAGTAVAATTPTTSTTSTPQTTLAPPATTTPDVVVADPAQAGVPGPAATPNLTLSSYDPASGNAVLAPGANAGPASGGSAAPVQTGQLIDSPPTPAAPQGALVAVTGVQPPAADGSVSVTTRPASLPELLGSTDTSLHTPLSPGSIQVQPEVSGLQISTNLGPASGQGSISGGIGLSANGTVPLSNGSSAALSGSMQLDPTIDFSYQGGVGAIDPQQARIGFALGAHADWHISGNLTASTTPIKIPLAHLSSSPVVMVGPLPVVINLDFTLSADISADGTVTVDAEQSYDGSWGVHSDYVKGSGWTTTTDPGTSTISPLQLALSGAASVKTGLLAEGSIALYDTLGVKASIEPYLRLAANGAVQLSPTNTTALANGTVTLFGGLDINGALMARLAVLGTPILEADLPFLAFQREWQLTSVSTGQAPTPSVTWTPLDSNSGDDNLSAYLKTQPDWDPYAYKSSCPDGSRLAGLSFGADRGLCTNATVANLWDAGHPFVVDHGGTYVSTDWAPGYNKDQCPANYFATGFSRNGKAMGILCARSSVPLGTSSRVVWFNSGDNRPAAAGGGDFAYGYAKGQCADDEYVAGFAFSQPWYELWASRPYALLCQKLS